MRIVKSAGVGLLAVIAAAVIFPIFGFFAYRLFAQQDEGVAVGFDYVAAARSPWFWVIAAAVFFSAFCWQYRRLSN